MWTASARWRPSTPDPGSARSRVASPAGSTAWTLKVLRYPGHAEQMRFLLDLGLSDSTVLDVRTHLTYRDVLVRRLRQRLGGAYADAVIARVDAEGEIDGETCTRTIRIVDRYDDASGLTAMQRCTAFPAASAAMLLASGAVPGGGTECLEGIIPGDVLLADLAERGIEDRASRPPACASGGVASTYPSP